MKEVNKLIGGQIEVVRVIYNNRDWVKYGRKFTDCLFMNKRKSKFNYELWTKFLNEFMDFDGSFRDFYKQNKSWNDVENL